MVQRVFNLDMAMRALRMVLVFALVFWSSFRIECLAFASSSVDAGAPAGKMLSNLTVYEVDGAALEGATDRTPLKVKVGSLKPAEGGEAEQAPTFKIATNGGVVQFAAEPEWADSGKGVFTVTYTDGVEDQEIFADQVSEVEGGEPTPAFDNGNGGNEPSREDGYRFAGWDPEVAETVSDNVTYTAKWEKTQHTVTYTDGVGGEAFADQSHTYGEGDQVPPFDNGAGGDEPTREGYTFAGWSGPDTTEDGDLVYTATWNEKATRTVTFTAVVGTESYDLASYPVEDGGAMPEVPEPPAYEGYQFSGWDPDPGSVTEVTGDLTFTATYAEVAKETYTVSFVDGLDGAELASYPVEDGGAIPSVPDVPEHEGYQFSGWDTDPYSVTEVTGSLTFTATYAEVQVEPTADDQVEIEGQYQEGEQLPSADGESAAADPADYDVDVRPTAEDPAVDEYGNPVADGGSDDQPQDQPAGDQGDVPGDQAGDQTGDQVDPNDIRLAGFAHWSVSDPSVAEISFDEATGVATLVGKGHGRVTVTCEVDPEKLPDGDVAEDIRRPTDEAAASGAHNPVISFDVIVVYIEALEVYRVDEPETRVDNSTEPLRLTDENREGFGFWARANVTDGDQNDGVEHFDSKVEEPLSQSSGGLLRDLRWSVAAEDGGEVAEDVASITSDGKLTLAKDATVQVRCSTDQGLDGEAGDFVASFIVTTKDEEPEDEIDQGASHPQDPLKVTIQKPVHSKDAKDGEDGDENGESESGKDGENGEAGIDTQSDGESPAESSEGAPESGGSDSNLKIETTSADIYAADFESIEGGETTKDFTMYVDGKEQLVTGKGCSLSQILDKAGLPMEERTYQSGDHKGESKIDTIEFVNYVDSSVELNWSKFVGQTGSEHSYVIVARESRVKDPNSQNGEESTTRPAPPRAMSTQEDGNGEVTENAGESGSGDAESAEGPGNNDGEGGSAAGASEAEGGGASGEGSGEAGDDGTKLLDNTRFRILFEQPSDGFVADAGALRWIKEIKIKLKDPEPQKPDDGEPDKELGISIAYNPVPEGMTAMLSAVPSQSVGSANFGYVWERSTDNGETWTKLDADMVQTLHVPTDKEHIGNLYRVKLETSLKNDEGKDRWAISDPVEIRVGDGLAVQLDYVPPIAGDYANFVAHVHGANEDDPNLEYVWQMSTDGGNTWSTEGILKNEHGKTLSILTSRQPAGDASSSSSESNQEVTLTYIRVVVTLGDQTAASNPQLLTVQAGTDDGTDTQNNPDGGTTPPEKKEPTNTNGDPTATEIADALNNSTATDIPWDNYEYPVEEDFGDYPVEDENWGYEEEYEPDTYDVTPIDSITYEDEEESEDQTVAEGEGEANLIVSKDVSKKVAEQKQKAEAKKNSTPGAKWTELSQPTPEDIRRILAENPYAPLAAPFALGITAAGAVEKLVFFRRQTK